MFTLWPWVALADPWLAPGDEGLRSDVQRLSDAGILRGPVTTWPLSWPDLARDALSADESELDGATTDALIRVRRMARAASARGFAGAGIRASASSDATVSRSFADTPREEGELALRASWLGERFAMNLQAAVVANPDDGKIGRPDGSYLGINVGNFMISAGYLERWWGPGWDGNLILSTNARPIPSLTIERNYTDPFKSPFLAWIGHWRASIAVGEAESNGVAVPKVRFLAARVNFKPRPWLEIGLTRTAQWCGGERPCDLGTFGDLLVGRDNQVEDGAPALEQPGNQMAGYDLRLRSPWKPLPVALYAQWIGEDEAGGLPSKFIGQFGIEGWGSSPFGGWRLRAEFSDTACSFMREDPEYGCAYRNAIYPQGYSYRGRLIGHWTDNDSRMASVAALLTRRNGDVIGLTYRDVELNRDGGEHLLTSVPLQLENVELRYSRGVGAGRISLGVGYNSEAIVAREGSRLQGFAVWQQGF